MPRPSSQSYDAVVIGGGAIGLAVAWRACGRGLRVAVVERGELGAGASHVAAGMLAPTSEAAFGEDDLLALNLDSARRWPRFAADLERASGVECGLRRCGTLAVARDRDEAEALERELSFRAGLGLEVARLLPSGARRLEPALAPTVRLALHAPDDHAVDPRALAGALAGAARAAGAAVRERAGEAALVVRGGRVAGVRAGGEELRCGQVVVAAGCWSGSLPGLAAGHAVPVRPVKGQILRLRDPAGPGLLRRVLRTAGGYVVPRGDGRYVLGATLEERGFDTAVTAGGAFALLRDAIEVLPGLGELEVRELSAGLRPGTPDNAPVLGPGTLPGLQWATGHYRHGILLAPVTADALAGSLAGEGLPPAASRFAATRFQDRGRTGERRTAAVRA